MKPRDCRYDAFKVKEGPSTATLRLEGMKVEDLYADGPSAGDPGLAGWEITIAGTGLLGEEIDETVQTGPDGYREFQKDYTHNKQTELVAAELNSCEVPQDGWTQSCPDPACYLHTVQPAAVAEVMNLDFGNYEPIRVTVCKVRDLDGDKANVSGWPVALTEEGTVVDQQVTGAEGCYTWTILKPEAGESYDVHEGDVGGGGYIGALPLAA